MFEADSPALAIGIAVSLLLLAPLAGCLEPIGEATQDALTDGSREQRSSGSQHDQAPKAEEAGDGESSRLQEDDVAETYESAFSSVEPGKESPDRVSWDVHAEENASGNVVDMSLHWNARDKVAVMSFQNGTPGNERRVQSETDRPLVFGTVDKTSFVGSPSHLAADYNESGNWNDDTFNLSDMGTSGSSGEGLDVSSMVEEIDDLPESANVEWKSITHEGKDAYEIEIEHENETDSIDMRAVVEADTERPLLVEGTFENATSGPTYLDMTFAYGEDAGHEHADKLLRMEAMALTTGNGSPVTNSPTVNETYTLTVLPSQNPGMIPLEEVEVRLQNTSGGPSTDPVTEVSLPAEDGRIVNDQLELVYDDVDGDGAVSPDDEIRFKPLSEEAASWHVMLYDEKTQTHMAPGFEVWAALAAIAGLATVSRRRSG